MKMSIVCSICQDALTEKPQCLPENQELIAAALQCGHLFHKICITQWYHNGGANTMCRHLLDCPCCKKSTNFTCDVIRIYPTCEQDTVPSKSESKVLEQLEDSRQIIEQQQQDLITETNAHESLKLEHGKLQSELHELREETREAKEMYATLEESLKHKIKTLEKEIVEAKETIYEMRSRERRLYRQLNLFKMLHEENQKSYLAGKSVEEDMVNQILVSLSNTDADEISNGEIENDKNQLVLTPLEATTVSTLDINDDDIYW